ncbi:tRNA-specific 2-thiouridylase [Persephonella hydrogeniphila]|uniref:tRNA-specific 2-thiouridylase MnmA n=1 Tax=Persephonella hydrogeniphila TaxID=198703 RepID=A0A285NM34_9AQUI|nr:tRNA 2-thiouridine(34) synthase MnmA [Persephonella hydrogeniphila]SNZ09983.1 tRNA-specific 2-thiouridylase [Persephonella hydrogeniphila]
MKKVAVAMSGGVDSSVSALLLKEKGYDVIGVTLKMTSVACDTDIQVCCSPEDVKDAKRVATYLGIEHYILDWEEIFKKKVIEYFVREYKKGKTPNPCAVCNREVKTGLLAKYVRDILGVDYLATGHYLGIDSIYGHKVIKRGKDKNKDQSYFMALLEKESLNYLLFPLENMTKEDTRKIAEDFNIPVAKKSESFEICFTAGKTPGEYLQETGLLKNKTGDIVLKDGTKVGIHKGLSNYTIGQRRGLGIAWKEPLYVIDKNPEKNILVVGKKEELFTDYVDTEELNLFVPEDILEKLDISVQGRYRQKPVNIQKIEKKEKGYRFYFKSPQQKFASGQVLAIYSDDKLLGGGIIL